MKDMYIDRGNRRRRRGSRLPVIILVVFIAAAAGLGGFFGASYYMKVMQEQEAQDTQAASAANELEEGLIVDESDETAALAETGVYGLWYSAEEDSGTEEAASDYDIDEDVWMADFVDTRTPVEVKGAYLSYSYMNAKLEDVIDLIDRTELNAIIVDIKSDEGYITYSMDYDAAKEIGATTPAISNIDKFISRLHEHGIYVIARVVTLKDPLLAEKRPELALYNTDGTLFRDSSGLAWANPYKSETWDYLIGVCRQCALDGFDEINLDYIRFSTDSGMSNVDFGPEAEGRSRIDAISDGIKRLCEEIKPLGVYVSADVYGAIISSSVDAAIVGQSFFRMSQYLDYICPMVYPSHYGDGYYGLDYPDCHPYELVYNALLSAKKVLYMIDDTVDNKAEVRPWLQDFTASWVKHHLTYGAEEVRAQIDAVYDAGYTQWMLWNAAAKYSEGGLLTEGGE